jgi:hypothetical protein
LYQNCASAVYTLCAVVQQESGLGVREWSGEERKAAARLPHSKGMFT